MSAVKSKALTVSSLELEVRRTLWRNGFRFRANYRIPLMRRRSIDIAFPGAKVAVFIDGCFWHSCPLHGVKPKANWKLWSEKLARNRERDLETTLFLHKAGWVVMRFWEHESLEDMARAVERELFARRRHSLFSE